MDMITRLVAAVTDVARGASIVMKELTRALLTVRRGVYEGMPTLSDRLRARTFRCQAEWAMFVSKSGGKRQ